MNLRIKIELKITTAANSSKSLVEALNKSMTKLKKFFVFFAVVLLLSTLGGLVYAARKTEVQYPQIGNIIPPTTTTDLLPDYIRYVFSFAIAVSAIIAFVLLVYGGVRWLTSAGNPGALNDARERMKAGGLGLIILLGAYAILNTINPQLVVLQAGTAVNWGITLYSDAGCANKKQEVTRNTTGLAGLGAGYLKFNPDVPWWSLDVKINNSIIIRRDNDDTCRPIGAIADSVEFMWKLPGVYLVRDDGAEKFLPASTATLGDFNDRTTRVKLVDQQGVGLIYGAVLHEDQNWKGKCLIKKGEKGWVLTYDLPDRNTSSVTTFVSAETPGYGGVTFYMDDNFGGQESPTYKEQEVPWFGDGWNDKVTSMKINGKYMAVLFEHRDYLGKCQVFTESDSNFRDDDIGRCGCGPFGWGCTDCLSSFIIIPTR